MKRIKRIKIWNLVIGTTESSPKKFHWFSDFFAWLPEKNRAIAKKNYRFFILVGYRHYICLEKRGCSV